MLRRHIIEIDETKCDGCGLCVPACEEGAIRIVGGKARVVSDAYCDGLGACLGHCPRGAISVVQRAAAPFDRAAVVQHLTAAQGDAGSQGNSQPKQCPGTASWQLNVLAATPAAPCFGSAVAVAATSPYNRSQLANWPLQLHLMPPTAPYLHGADLLLVADCVPPACADFHSRFLDGRPLAIACPKLDNTQAYVMKLGEMIQVAQLRSITVVHMDVPCCTGLLHIAQAAAQRAGAAIPVHDVVVPVAG